MAVRLSMSELNISSAADLCALDNLEPPPMENAADALGVDRYSADFDFISTPIMKGPVI